MTSGLIILGVVDLIFKIRNGDAALVLIAIGLIGLIGIYIIDRIGKKHGLT